MFRKFNFKEIKKATEGYSTVIGRGGFGTVYKAHFSDGQVAAVKRMNRVSEQGEDDFCREIELLARLHHRHLVALRGFCINKQERYLFLRAYFCFLTTYIDKPNPSARLMAGFCCTSTWEMEA
jgi:serine/threonine protein kinase